MRKTVKKEAPAGLVGARKRLFTNTELNADAKKKEVIETVSIPPLKIRTVVFTIRGTTPLIVHRMDSKSVREMEEKQTGAAKHKRANKVPTDEFIGSLYTMPGTKVTVQKRPASFSDQPEHKQFDGHCYVAKGRFGVPAQAFKLAAVSACRNIEGISMTLAYGAFHVPYGLVEVLDERGRPVQPIMRRDIVRIGNFGAKKADLRYRGEMTNWQIKLPVQFNEAVINLSQLANLFNTGGFAVGVCEWRPEKKGGSGMFEVVQ